MTVAHEPNLLDQIERLPPLPAIVRRVLSVTESPTSTADDVAKVLGEDQTIAAKLLRVANSSFYGSSRQVTQISRAVMMMGLVGVRNLVLGIAARDAITAGAPPTPEHTTLWRHSIAAAAAAELIARPVKYRPAEEAFVAGLLHDIGQLAMVAFDPEAFATTFEKQESDLGFLTIERSLFGLDHTEAGFHILSRWGLPPAICHAVQHHHEQETDPDEPLSQLLAIVVLADTIAHMMGFGFDVPIGKFKRAENAARIVNLGDQAMARVLDDLVNRIEQADDMFVRADDVHRHSESPARKRALWVASEDAQGRCIGRLLLECHGYDLETSSPDRLANDLPPDDLVVIALSEEDAAAKLASRLSGQGCRRIVVTVEPKRGVPARHQDAESGVRVIPRLFTIFDIQWVEEQLGL